MKTKSITRNVKTALIALGLTASFSAYAAPMTLTGISGNYTVWDGSPVLVPVASNLANATTALGGNAAAPGGNVELSKFGGPLTVMSGIRGGHTVTLSSLQLTDWNANGNALATRYIQDASMAAFGFQLNGAQLSNALTSFFTLDLNPGAGVVNPWQMVSDPNISYVDISDNILAIGLAGLLDASPFLSGISGIQLPPGEQASEVVKVTFDGSDPMYLYGFKATPSGVSANGAFTGNYEVQVPEPTGLALVGIGLLGLIAGRRRR